MNTHQSLMKDLQIDSFVEGVLFKRFRPKMLRRTIKTQRNVYKGQAASRIARAKNPALDDRKKRYRQLYLAMKNREQQMYGSLARQQSLKH